VKIYKNLQEFKVFNAGFPVETIFGGHLLAVRGKEFITFYDWETQILVRRVDVSPAPKNVFWSENGQSVVLALEENFYLLTYDSDQVVSYVNNKDPSAAQDEDDEGCEEAFQFTEEYQEVIASGLWVSSDCFVYTNQKGHIYYLIGQKTMKLGNADKKQFILGYDSKQNRLYLVDKNFNIYSYSLLLSVVNYQSAILNEDLHGAELYFKDVPETQYTKLAKFLEANDKKDMAFEITPDQDHKFDLAIALNKTEAAFEIAEAQQSVEKWKKVGDMALISGFFQLAEQCFKKSKDFNSLLLFYSSYGDEEGLQSLLVDAENAGKYNIAFETAYLLALPEKCAEILMKSKRYAEAGMFAKAYCPHMIPMVMKEWSNLLTQIKLPFIPENIFESPSFKDAMAESQQTYKEHVLLNLYNQPRAPADEIELQRERWYADDSTAVETGSKPPESAVSQQIEASPDPDADGLD